MSNRVYKKAFPIQQALDMIQNGECGVFNPELLKCFLQVELDIRRQVYGSGEDRK